MRRRSKPLRPKLPSRRDSQAVVESILVAATEILENEGMEKLTTNRIAARAGVGVASVYRYFKDKVAIVAEIDVRNRRANAQKLLAPLIGVEKDLPTIVRAFLRHFLDTKDGRSRLRRTLMTEVPLAWTAGPAGELWSQTLLAARQAFATLRPDLSPVEIERRVFVAFHAVQGVAMGQLVFPQTDMDLEDAVAQVERLILPFLLR